ncbi:MAG TPA: DUF1476 domain-containing protein [Devosia sp.]|nr:DUF1476 domain-containing protein [Devosia sp.]
MSSFDEREKAQEAKFAHDAELRFKAEARRNKLLAVWAAELMGRTDVDAYVSELIATDFQEAGDEDVFRKLIGDLSVAGVNISDIEVREKIEECFARAKEEVLTEV